MARVEKCSQINDSLPVRYVSQMYDSKMSQSGRDSMIAENKVTDATKPKRIDDYSMEELVKRFLVKDSMIVDSGERKSSNTHAQHPPSNK